MIKYFVSLGFSKEDVIEGISVNGGDSTFTMGWLFTNKTKRIEPDTTDSDTTDSDTTDSDTKDPITIEINDFLHVENPSIDSSFNTISIDSSFNTISIDSSFNTISIDSSFNTISIDSSFNTISIEIIESPPNPIVELMKQHSKFALLIGLNYVDYPEITLNNRIKGINNAKQILLNMNGFTEENILVLIEPSREKVLTTLNTILGSSNLISELIIYYSGYGNGIMKIDAGFCAEPGVIDNLAKQIMPADFVEIGQDKLTDMLNNSCCKTVCILDMCPYGNDDMLMKWSADINNHVKVITLCESDSHNTNKNQLIQSMLRETYGFLLNPPSF